MNNTYYKIREDGSVAKLPFTKTPPIGWFKTEQQALEFHKNRVKAEKEESNRLRAEAAPILDKIEQEFYEFQNMIKKKYNGNVYADGEAQDDSGLSTYHTVSVVMKGEFRVYEFTRELEY